MIGHVTGSVVTVEDDKGEKFLIDLLENIEKPKTEVKVTRKNGDWTVVNGNLLMHPTRIVQVIWEK